MAPKLNARACLLTALLTGALTCGACGPLPTAPSPIQATVKQTVPLVVVVRTADGVALPNAGVTVESHLVGYTDAAGRIQATVPSGVEILVGVAASGRHWAEAWGTLLGPETWTFYLEVLQ